RAPRARRVLRPVDNRPPPQDHRRPSPEPLVGDRRAVLGRHLVHAPPPRTPTERGSTHARHHTTSWTPFLERIFRPPAFRVTSDRGPRAPLWRSRLGSA